MADLRERSGASVRAVLARGSRALAEGVWVVGLHTVDKLVVRIHVEHDARWRGKPLHVAIVEAAMHYDIVGAVVYRTPRAGGPAGARNEEQSALDPEPTVVSIIDREDKVQQFLPVLDELMGSGLIADSDVEVIRHRGRPVA